jgi:hypothetical protein
MRLISSVLAVQNFVNRVDSGLMKVGAGFKPAPTVIDKVPAIPYKNSAAAS